jgi:hypothetical protein
VQYSLAVCCGKDIKHATAWITTAAATVNGLKMRHRNFTDSLSVQLLGDLCADTAQCCGVLGLSTTVVLRLLDRHITCSGIYDFLVLHLVVGHYSRFYFGEGPNTRDREGASNSDHNTNKEQATLTN